MKKIKGKIVDGNVKAESENIEISGGEHNRMAQPVGAEECPRLPFPVVGVGASAGGLAAFKKLLKSLPSDSGMSFVLIQHLPPNHETMLADILRSETKMSVTVIEDAVAVEPNHVYVLRPGRVITIKEGKLHLGAKLERPGNNRPIDDFFRSLAEEQRHRAIGIILSGMGSNGTAGCQAIKAVGGFCIAQEPQSAEYPSMPRHLIEAGYADIILDVEEMPETLAGFAAHPYAKGGGKELEDVISSEQSNLRDVLSILRTRTRQDFGGYKKPTLMRRVQRRMGLGRVYALGEYAKLLRQSPSEVEALKDDLLIHVTGFFRDPESWKSFYKNIVVPFITDGVNGSSVRCWVSACSSGEEAYSLAMILTEEMEKQDKSFDLKIFATDMADRSLQHARQGIYPGGIETEVSPERLNRFFVKEDEQYKIKSDLREKVVFAPHNILQDPPFSKLDIISCRNLLIYLEPDVQAKVLALLHFGLRPGGALFLGSSETISGSENLFKTVDKKAKIYVRTGVARETQVTFPVNPNVSGRSSPRKGSTLQNNLVSEQISKEILKYHTPGAVTIDKSRQIIHFHGDTSGFIKQPKGAPTRDLFQLLAEELRGPVRAALYRAENDNLTVASSIASFDDKRLVIRVSPLEDGELFIISFDKRSESRSASESKDTQVATGAENELEKVREDLQSTIEELQSSNEGLRAANEEVLSINEELQSTSEEMETSREEMQSLNEELSTVNSQLQSKIEEHQQVSSDLDSLLSSTSIAVLFLDRNFRIRRFTATIRDLFDLISSDIGRPLSDLARKFEDPELVADCQMVLETLIPLEREIKGSEQKWFLRKVLPYRTGQNHIDGVVITFVDISIRKISEVKLEESQSRLSSELNAMRNLHQLMDSLLSTKGLTEALKQSLSALLILHDATAGDLRILDYGSGELAVAAQQGLPEEISAKFKKCRLEASLYEKRHPSADSVDRDPPKGSSLYSCQKSLAEELKFKHFRATPLFTSERKLLGVVTSYHEMPVDLGEDDRRVTELYAQQAANVIERYRALAEIRGGHKRAKLILEAASDFAILMLNTQGIITEWNVGAEMLTGFKAVEAIGQEGSIIFTPEDKQAKAFELELRTATENGRAADERWHLRKDGSKFWGSGVMTVALSSKGSPEGYVKIFRDQTLQKASETELQNAKQEALTANRMKDEFLATLSHELRTPLSAIFLWTKLLRNPALPSGKCAEALEAIELSAHAQKQLIDDILDTYRIDSGKLRLELNVTDVKPLITSCLDAVGPAAEARQIKVVRRCESDLGKALVDKGRIRQVIANVLANAVKFTSPGGEIIITTDRTEDSIHIEVSDNGIGIKSEFLPFIFERFRQADSSAARKHEGLGLGLAICKQFLDLHGGKIQAKSDGVGKGSSFIITIPALQEGVNFRQLPTTEKLDQNEPDLTGVSILVVEDQQTTRNALTILLEQNGAKVLAVSSAEEALKALEKNRPDVLISDIGMPNQDGYDFIRIVRERENKLKLNPIPALALTAFAGIDDRNRTLKAGFDLYLSKPVDPNEILQTVQTLANSRLQSSNLG